MHYGALPTAFGASSVGSVSHPVRQNRESAATHFPVCRPTRQTDRQTPADQAGVPSHTLTESSPQGNSDMAGWGRENTTGGSGERFIQHVPLNVCIYICRRRHSLILGPYR